MEQSFTNPQESESSESNISIVVNPLQAQTALERRQRLEDYAAHGLAYVFAFGFFALAFTALLGFVDIKEPVIASFLGTVIGYAAAKLDPTLRRYFFRGRDGTNP